MPNPENVGNYTYDEYANAIKTSLGRDPTQFDIDAYTKAGQLGGAPSDLSTFQTQVLDPSQEHQNYASEQDRVAANAKTTTDSKNAQEAANAITPGTYNAQGTMALMTNNVNDPTLSKNETTTATHVDPNATGATLTDNATVGNLPPVQAAQAAAGQATASLATLPPEPGVATYNAVTIGNMTPQMIAARGEVDPRSLVQTQYSQLMNFPPDQVPDWAKGAVRTAKEALASRGLGASSMAGEAITSALMSAALPIAQQDAKTFENMNLANLNNEQQALIVNTQARVQTMMSDQAATNAAQQFNAQSTNQMNQFYTQLATNVSQFNAAQLTAVSQSNASLDTQTGIANAAQANAIGQFNNTMQNNRDQFNAANQLIVDQSNVAWRRNVNTVNTAADNAANATNAQNSFNLSQTSLNNIWQKYRDDASYAFQSSENDKNRAATLALMNLNWDHQADAAFSSALGSAAFGFVKPVANAISNAINPNTFGRTAIDGTVTPVTPNPVTPIDTTISSIDG